MNKNAKKRARGKPFTSDRQPPSEAKRVKKRKTLLKEQIGIHSWEGIAEYINKNGATKFIKELQKLKGKSFAIMFLQAAEYFKPKLQRTEHTGENGKPIEHKITGMIIK